MRTFTFSSWIHFMFLFSVVSRSSAVECSTSDGRGSCEPLTPALWCKNGEGIGCANGNAASQQQQGCRRQFTCPQSGSASASSMASNISIVASPSNTNDSSDKHRIDLHIQWEDSNESDDVLSGYEVLIGTSSGVLRNHCGCLNRSIKYITLKGIILLGLTNSFQILIRTLPYTEDTLDDQTVPITIPLGGENICLSLVSNQNHCSSNNNLAYYTLFERDGVSATSSFAADSTDLMDVHFSWAGSDHLGVMLALTDSASSGGTSCTSPGHHPPCFIIKNTDSVMIQGLNASLNYTANLHRFNSSLCTGFSPTHLLDGCGSSQCCTNSILIVSPNYPNPATPTTQTSTTPTYATPTATPRQISAEATTPTTLKELETTNTTATPTTITTPTTDLMLHGSHRQYDIVVPVLCITVVGVVIISITVSVMLALLVSTYCSSSHKAGRHGDQGLGGMGLRHHLPNKPTLMYNRHHHYSSYPLLAASSSSTPSPLTEEIKSLYLSAPSPPLTMPPPALVPPPPPCNPQDPVLILYSPSVGEKERDLILTHLVGGLSQYGLSIHCHDTVCVKNPCQWMEAEIKKARAVLCVCSREFCTEWNQCPTNGKIPIVSLLKHLVHGTITRGESLSKFATVLLERADVDCIPSLYLQGDPRLFMLTELEEMAKFIQNIPSFSESM